MATRGRKPKPTALKLLDGNPGKRPLNENEPKPETIDSLKPPSYLSSQAKKKWKELAPQLDSLGILTNIDTTTFELYCQTYAKWRDANKHIEEEGSTFTTNSGYQQQTPWVSIAQTCVKTLQSLAGEFGMTPASRSRINASAPGSSKDEDPMQALLNGGW